MTPTFQQPRIRTRLLRTLLAAAALLLAPAAFAISGIEGTFEYALDAPWRIEPVETATGALDYGRIPIQITILDANQAGFDDEEHLRRDPIHGIVAPEAPPGPLMLGRFCALTVESTTASGATSVRRFGLSDLAEIERTRGSWRDEGVASEPARREVCRQDQGDACASLAEMARSSEWYGLAWLPVPAGLEPGSNVELALEAKIARATNGDCDSTDAADVLTLRNHVSIRLGHAPLPRFGDGWVYGDLHYHSQGTDNEGEAGHNYRGVVRAMGAMGLDFAFATEHASASAQLVDADMHLEARELVGSSNRSVLRDMNDARFRALLDDLHAPTGVNLEAAERSFLGTPPQSTRVAGKVPQIFLGGEVDIIGETADAAQFIQVGNGLIYDVESLCGGYSWAIAGSCAEPYGPPPLFEPADGGFLVRDLQGPNDISHFTRLHLVYLPRDAADASAFVPSNTSEYGGATRRLAEPFRNRAAVGPEIREHGYAFVAHPMSGLGGGSKGPDSLPWTTHMLKKAFAESAILGLQLWNEDTRFEHRLEDSDHALHGFAFAGPADDEYQGYERPEKIPHLSIVLPRDTMREGFYTGHFELDASAFLRGETGEGTASEENGLYDSLDHGTYLWDQMNLWGLDPSRTSPLAWLADGEPRRVFMAGGSDAHGDFNYRREGYFLGDRKITDTALGKPRNLVDVGLAGAGWVPLDTSPEELLEPASTQTLVGHVASPASAPNGFVATALDGTLGTASGSHVESPESGDVAIGDHPTPAPAVRVRQDVIVDALADGRFSVTDGPALRIAIDRNRNCAFDANDAPMGGIVDLFGEQQLPLLVEWKTTEDFGAVSDIALIVGSARGAQSRIYGEVQHGAHAGGLSTPRPTIAVHEQGYHYVREPDDYWRIEELPLVVPVTEATRLSGTESIQLDLRAFLAARGVEGERFFVRAVARTEGAVTRLAYTNPVWALQRDPSQCTDAAARAIDADEDGTPDACDVGGAVAQLKTYCGLEGSDTTIGEGPASGSSAIETATGFLPALRSSR